jgi:excisionase family DNA binding protein
VTDERKDVLNIEEAAKLFGVSVKTFNKVLHAECLPARKIGREWKFSRAALIDWVASGRSVDFYRENGTAPEAPDGDVGGAAELTPARRPSRTNTDRRTSGWRIELD